MIVRHVLRGLCHEVRPRDHPARRDRIGPSEPQGDSGRGSDEKESVRRRAQPERYQSRAEDQRERQGSEAGEQLQLLPQAGQVPMQPQRPGEGLELLGRRCRRQEVQGREKTVRAGVRQQDLGPGPSAGSDRRASGTRTQGPRRRGDPLVGSRPPSADQHVRHGKAGLEQCFKSCLAATCGCDDAPGMEGIDDQFAAIKKNDEAKDPVEDSPPMWQYKRADIVDCGKGMAGKKITEGLYADVQGGPEGWVEVCSDEFFNAMGTPGDIGKKNCGNSKALLAGCVWDEVKGSCVYGLKKLVQCYTRYVDDNKL